MGDLLYMKDLQSIEGEKARPVDLDDKNGLN